MRCAQKSLVLADRGAPAFLNQASTEQYVKPPARLHRVDRQGIFIAIREQEQRVWLDQITPVIESPFHCAIADSFDRYWISEPCYMDMSSCAGEYRVGCPATGRAAPDIWCLFQWAFRKWARSA